MGSTKKTPAKAGKSAVKAHHARGNRDVSRTSSPEISEINTPSEASPGPSRSGAHLPPTQEERKKNGRVEGRNLIPWSRPRMADKLLLHIMYETTRHRIDVPWDAIAHRFHPGSTGGAIMQHLNRLRGILVAEGHLVPPIVQKPGSKVYVDPKIRGYVRKYPESEDMTTSRPVSFEEVVEDPKYNLPDAFEGYRQPTSARRESRISSTPKVATPGSSRASSALKAPIKGSPKISGILKDLTAKNSAPKKTPVKTPVKKTPAKKASLKKVSAKKVEEEDDELEIKEEDEQTSGSDSDGDFDPTHESASRMVRRSSRPRKVARSYAEVEVEDDEEAAEPFEDYLDTVGSNADGRSVAQSQGDGYDDDADADADMEADGLQYIKPEYDGATATAVTGHKSHVVIEVDQDAKVGKRAGNSIAEVGHSNYDHTGGNRKEKEIIQVSEDEENGSFAAGQNPAHQTPQTPKGHNYHHNGPHSYSSPIAASKARSAILNYNNGTQNGIPNGMPNMDLESMVAGSHPRVNSHPNEFNYTGEPVTAFSPSNVMYSPFMNRRNSSQDGVGFQGGSDSLHSSEDSFERSSPAMGRENGFLDNTVNPAELENFSYERYFQM